VFCSGHRSQCWGEKEKGNLFGVHYGFLQVDYSVGILSESRVNSFRGGGGKISRLGTTRVQAVEPRIGVSDWGKVHCEKGRG